MSCNNPECFNFNKNSLMYCDKCIQAELDKMTYEEVVDLYTEGKEWAEGIYVDENDKQAEELINKFKEGWFALMNIVLLSRATEKKEDKDDR